MSKRETASGTKNARARNRISNAISALVESLETRTLLSGSTFTLATLSDTQYSVESFPNTFKTQTAWVAAHAVGGTAADAFPDNIAFFAHQGDMLRRGYSDFQAANADAALKNLDGKVPYTVSIGNHDYDNQFDDLDQHVSSANFTQWFGDARYQAISDSGFGGSSLDQRNHFSTFTAAGREFLVLSIEWEASDASLAWAQSVINAHRQDPVILTTHEYLNGSGRTTSTLEPNAGFNSGEGIYQKLVKPNAQIFMVLSGHTGAIRSQTSLNNAGSSVYEIVADFEGRPNAGDGWMQLLQFDLAANTITGTNYSATLGTSEAGPSFNVNFNQRFAFSTAGAPIANDDTIDLAPATSLTFDVRGNDVDADNDVSAETVSFSSLPAGVTYDSTSGLFTYAPDSSFRGNVSFTYTLTDAQTHQSNTATATLRVNAAPVANDDDAVSTAESKPVTLNVLANDSDDNAADNSALKAILTTLPSHGAVTVNSDGTFTYTPDPDPTHQFASDAFTYVASDGKSNSAPVTVSINVRPAAPVYTYPSSETTNAGTRTGSFANLGASDGNVESIKEVISSGVDVDQRWKFVNVPAGNDLTVAINAWRSFSNPGTGDEYHLQYSTNGSTWSDLTLLAQRGSKDVTRTRFDANEPYQLWTLPATLSGTIYIRATDVNTSGTETADTLTVDELFIRSGVTFPQVSIAASDGAERTANDRPVTFTVTRTGSGTSIRNPLTVSYTLGGSATPDSDYTAPTQTTVTLPAGQNSTTFSFTPINDGIAEDPETLVATLVPDNAYDLSAASSATGTITDFYLDNTPPTQPTITGISSTSTTVSLNWSASTDDTAVTSYQILRNGVSIASVSGSTTTFADTGLASNTSYTYTVRAQDDAGNVSSDSAPAAITTRLAAPALTGSKSTIKSRGNKSTSVTLQWNAISGASGFYVYASLNGGAFTRTFVAAGSTSYVTSALSSGNWIFKITAGNASGESDFSNTYSVLV
jgi:VCBS repeat-containing protein